MPIDRCLLIQRDANLSPPLDIFAPELDLHQYPIRDRADPRKICDLSDGHNYVIIVTPPVDLVGTADYLTPVATLLMYYGGTAADNEPGTHASDKGAADSINLHQN